MKRTAALALACGLLSATASADLPPPDGFKFVGYELHVDNLKAFPDYVLLAYPASTSDGVPMEEYQLVSDGAALSVGRRGGTPQLYAMKRADFEKFQAEHKPSMPTQDPALADLFKSDRVKLCTGATVTPSFQLPKSDPRNAVVQTLKLEAVDAKGCRLSPVADAPAPAVTTRSTAPADPVVPTRADPSSASSPPARHGCGSCSIKPRPHEGSLLLLLSAVALGLGRRRQRRVFR